MGDVVLPNCDAYSKSLKELALRKEVGAKGG